MSDPLLKKSGLADSPLFKRVSPPSEPAVAQQSSPAEAHETQRQPSSTTAIQTDTLLDRQPSKHLRRQAPKARIVHQGIDIRKDQADWLKRIQFALWRRDDRKPTLRDQMLHALDLYIEKMRAELPDV